ncbi:CAP domain-containing protein [Miltoncostaea marina]|uniref:CAP domain-containing protein n=1 Tax=Miltoncostaea marina TaxID=2843215 RepID=UPI001C3D6DF4|nr:CAP domain-containing protein [Miltoncostaea marina]
MVARTLPAVAAAALAGLAGAALTPDAAQARDASRLGCPTALPAGVVDPGWGAELLAEVNRHRRATGLRPVREDPVLARAAAWKARDVLARAYGGHDDPGLGRAPSRTAQTRAQTCGFTSGYAYENLLMRAAAAPPLDARSALAAWLASPGHRRNIEQPAWRFVGTGVAAMPGAAPGMPGSAASQLFSAVAAPRTGVCPTLVASVRPGRTVALAPRACRAGGGLRVSRRPARGRLTPALVYAAPRRLGTVTMRLRWPDTGVVQPVMVYVVGPRAREGRVRSGAQPRTQSTSNTFG